MNAGISLMLVGVSPGEIFLLSNCAIHRRGHHRALAGGTSTSELHHCLQRRGHHRALAGGTSILLQNRHKTDEIAFSSKVERPPAKARWCPE